LVALRFEGRVVGGAAGNVRHGLGVVPAALATDIQVRVAGLCRGVVLVPVGRRRREGGRAARVLLEIAHDGRPAVRGGGGDVGRRKLETADGQVGGVLQARRGLGGVRAE